jgi:hypothetical protein
MDAGAPENVSAYGSNLADEDQWQITDGGMAARGLERRIGPGTIDRNGAALAKKLRTAVIVRSKKASTAMKNWATAAAVAGLHLRRTAWRIILMDRKWTTKERAEEEGEKSIPPAWETLDDILERAEGEGEKIIPPTTAVTLGPWETLGDILEAIYDAILCACPCSKKDSESTYVGSSYYYTHDQSTARPSLKNDSESTHVGSSYYHTHDQSTACPSSKKGSESTHVGSNCHYTYDGSTACRSSLIDSGSTYVGSSYYRTYDGSIACPSSKNGSESTYVGSSCYYTYDGDGSGTVATVSACR